MISGCLVSLPLFSGRTIPLVSGLEEKHRSFSADTGVAVGVDETAGQGDIFIPLTFQTRAIHSAQWLYDVRWCEDTGRINLTAVLNVHHGKQKSLYPRGITISSSARQTYTLVYRDPNEKTHDMVEVRVPQK